VVPSKEKVRNWSVENGLSDLSYEQLCENLKLKRVILEGITNTCKANSIIWNLIPAEVALIP